MEKFPEMTLFSVHYPQTVNLALALIQTLALALIIKSTDQIQVKGSPGLWSSHSSFQSPLRRSLGLCRSYGNRLDIPSSQIKIIQVFWGGILHFWGNCPRWFLRQHFGRYSPLRQESNNKQINSINNKP